MLQEVSTPGGTILNPQDSARDNLSSAFDTARAELDALLAGRPSREDALRGASNLARTGRDKLEPFGKAHHGLQIESLLMGVGVCLDDAAGNLDPDGQVKDPRPRIPRVDLAYGLDPVSTSD